MTVHDAAPAARARGRRVNQYRDQIRELMRHGTLNQALDVLLECVTASRGERSRLYRPTEYWFVEHAAECLHRLYRFDDEVELLGEWIEEYHAAGEPAADRASYLRAIERERQANVRADSTFGPEDGELSAYGSTTQDEFFAEELAVVQPWQHGMHDMEPVTSSQGFVCLDVEATGVDRRGGDRVLELGIVVLSPELEAQSEWETLVDPGADWGVRTTGHLTLDDVEGAPTASEILGDLVDLLDGRVLVCHNAAFELAFVANEFRAAGIDPGNLLAHSFCTMHAAPRVFPGVGRRLTACCGAAGIAMGEKHTALSDARAAARLLQRLSLDPSVRHDLGAVPPVDFSDLRSKVTGGAALLPREHAPSRTVAGFRIASAVEDLPRSGTAAIDDYLAVVDRSIVDFTLPPGSSAPAEVDLPEDPVTAVVAAEATGCGIGDKERQRTLCDKLHRLGVLMLSDGPVGPRDRGVLRAVARRLGIDPAEADEALGPELQARGTTLPQPGDVVVLGETRILPRDCWARRAGNRGVVVLYSDDLEAEEDEAVDGDKTGEAACDAADKAPADASAAGRTVWRVCLGEGSLSEVEFARLIGLI